MLSGGLASKFVRRAVGDMDLVTSTGSTDATSSIWWKMRCEVGELHSRPSCAAESMEIFSKPLRPCQLERTCATASQLRGSEVCFFPEPPPPHCLEIQDVSTDPTGNRTNPNASKTKTSRLKLSARPSSQIDTIFNSKPEATLSPKRPQTLKGSKAPNPPPPPPPTRRPHMQSCTRQPYRQGSSAGGRSFFFF